MKKATVILRFLTAVVCMAVLLLSVGCSAEPEAMQPGSCYITETCLYRNPLSAVFWGNDDDGLRYCIGESTFSWQPRDAASQYAGQIDNITWLWSEFPYTDAEWNAMLEPQSDLFNHIAIENIHARYQHPLYQPLDEHRMLLLLDEEIWLVTMTPTGTDDNPWRIESIHTLVPEASAS